MVKNMNASQFYRESELMDNKRMFERFDMEIPVLIECLRPKRRKKLILVTVNLSASGAYFNTPRPYPTNAEVKVEVLLHDGQESFPVITVSGRVLRSEPKGMAVLFNDDYEITAMEELSVPPLYSLSSLITKKC